MTRMLEWLLIAVMLTAVIAYVAPQQVAVTAYKLSLVTAAAVVGYWLDRSLFPYARPDKFINSGQDNGGFAFSMQRRAIIIAACIVGVSLGA